MSAALVAPALAAALLAPGEAPRADGTVPAESTAVRAVDGYVASTTAPVLFVEGQPYVVEVRIRAVGEKSVGVPSWLVTPAGWLVDERPLARRESKDEFTLQPGQEITTELDLAPAIAARLEKKPRDFRIRFAEADEEPRDVVLLGLPESGLDFETLPKEMLSRYQVVLQTTGGPIWVELWPDVAPNHVRNFLDLCSTGYYDGSPFHRVIPGFMVQGGRSKDGRPAPRKLEAEFSTRRHVAGVLSAARLGSNINSATTEFFVVHRTSPHLDGNYTAFGQVLWGMDSVEELVRSVEVQYSFVEALAKNGVRLDTRRPNVATPMNTPNPSQSIEQALIVKATKSRPRGK